MIHKNLTTKRILSIDAFRGITILVMIFVNELSGVREIPSWMKHMAAKADAMSFVDVVFPAFLFIAGMSIPFALNNRINKGDDSRALQKHILGRTIGLLTLGFFMVNAEGNRHPEFMPFSIQLWSLLFYAAAIMIWNVYRTQNKTLVYILRGIGIATLVALALVYRSGEDGTEHIRPRWWGILGLIGWSYLFNCIFYQLFRGKIKGMILVIIFCTALYALTKYFCWWDTPAKNATHIATMAAGIIASLIFFDEARPEGTRKRFIEIFGFALLLFVAGYWLRPYYKISKIYATPTWGLYCSAICCILYSFLYWLVDLKGWKRWTAFFKPAGANPLLTYIIPDILYSITAYLHISLFPNSLRYGLPGMLWCIFYAVAIMGIVIGLNRMKIRLSL